jgi:hypothetical protein
MAMTMNMSRVVWYKSKDWGGMFFGNVWEIPTKLHGVTSRTQEIFTG